MIHYFGFALLIISFLGIFIAIIGMFRFPDFFTKQHALSIIDSAMLPLALVGLIFLQTNVLMILKLLLIIILLLLLNPLSTYMLAKANYNQVNKNRNIT